MSEVSQQSEVAHGDNEECRWLYMKYPGVKGAFCALDCDVCQRGDSLLVKRISTGRLAYDIGLRSEDIIRSINVTKVDGVSVSSFVETMKWLDVNRPMVIGIERKRQSEVEFWWFVFQLVNEGDYPRVNVLSSIHNTTGEFPNFKLKFEIVNVFTYLPPPQIVNIVPNSSQLYLSGNVQTRKLEFLPFDQSAAQFSMYKYGGTNPGNGVPVALVVAGSCIEAVGGAEVKLALTDFPPFMTGQPPNSSNSRFFYLKLQPDGYSLLESETQSGYCIAKDSGSTDAVAEKPPTDLSKMNISLD